MKCNSQRVGKGRNQIISWLQMNKSGLQLTNLEKVIKLII